MEALSSEGSRISCEWEIMQNNTDYYSLSARHFSYKKRGLYVEQLENYWKYFEKDQVLVLSSEELFENPQATVRQVFEYLSVDPEYKVPDLKPKCVGSNRTDVDRGVYDCLDKYFCDYNRLLYQSIGKEFNW